MSIHQEVELNGSPEQVYDVLMNAEKFAAMSGGRAATISSEVGGAVSLFGGDIEARNVELVPGRRVVQAWRSGNWPEGVHSIVRFELNAAGTGTKLAFDQSGYPDGAEGMLEGGWRQMYWDPMNAMLASRK